MNAQWKECLYDRFRWIAKVPEDGDLLEVADRVLSIVGEETEQDPVQQSTVGSAVPTACTAGWVSFHRWTFAYARARGGVIGCYVVSGEVVMTTIRRFFEKGT